MHGPTGSPSHRRPLLLYGVVRWTIAGIIGTTFTAGLFVAMTRMIDGSWILEQMLRVFPLEQTDFVDPCEGWEHEQTTLVIIEGTVGYLGREGFVALPEAQIVGEHRRAPAQRVEVSNVGEFRFVTPFAEQRPEKCAAGGSPEPASPGLLIQAPDCSTRRVTVTRSWLPHRVLLHCSRQ